VIDQAVQQIVDASFKRTSGILKAHEAVLDRGAKLLLERETLDENALKPIRAEIQAGIPPVGVGRLAQG
jgi:cell division protease FtsH